MATMDFKKLSRDKSKLLDLDVLKTFSNEELVSKVLQLQSHNEQLKNIIAKRDYKKKEEAPKRREFDFKKCHLQHVLFKVLYLGWNYQGFVCQEDTSDTIEYHLMEALLKCCLIESRQQSNYHRCGRTDKGVSSYGQVISITVRASEPGKPSLSYCKMLNRLLPKDIRVVAWCPVGEEVSARFDCTKRIYRYFFPKGNLNLMVMNEAAQHLIGEHDFRNFCKMDVENGVTNFVRSIRRVDLKEINGSNEEETGFEMCRLELEGQAFLWHQVRCIMSVLYLVGQKLELPSIISDLLNVDVCPRKPQYPLADPLGLNLFETEYPFNGWISEESEIAHITSLLQQQWAVHEIRATHIKEILSDLKNYISTPVLHQNAHLLKRETKLYKPLLTRHFCSKYLCTLYILKLHKKNYSILFIPFFFFKQKI
ncbi:tRNA pseudouridine(38/39) synthase isoform X2 [Rhodnius prolixus]|uniref:tRNA pseudouridine(38/39) synthase isoform X2 n=1 Tax=Rhodnius prolixus TaxID=13249 RepID=UPI003D18BAC3